MVNALSKSFEVFIKREESLSHPHIEMEKIWATYLMVKDNVVKEHWDFDKFFARLSYFDSSKFSVVGLKHLLRAKAVCARV